MIVSTRGAYILEDGLAEVRNVSLRAQSRKPLVALTEGTETGTAEYSA